MKKELIYLKATSPEVLANELSELAKNSSLRGLLAVLGIAGEKAILRQFEVAHLTSNELKSHLRLEAAELLSASPEDIELSYQIFSSTDKIKGIFVAAQRILLVEYLRCCQSFGIVLTEINSAILSTANAFLLEHRDNEGCLCFIDFFGKGILHLTVFDGAICILVREIHFDNDGQAFEEIANSLKYSCSKVVSKKFSQIFVSGSYSEKTDLTLRIEKEFEAKINLVNIEASLAQQDLSNNFFKINLMNYLVVSSGTRSNILRALNIILAFSVIVFAFFSVSAINNAYTIKKLRASFSAQDYEFAKGLQERLNLLSHAK
jgi:hypothetical protein